jgi:hypothetical protein
MDAVGCVTRQWLMSDDKFLIMQARGTRMLRRLHILRIPASPQRENMQLRAGHQFHCGDIKVN